MALRAIATAPAVIEAAPEGWDLGEAGGTGRTRRADLGDGAAEVPVLDRAALAPGAELAGPAVVDQPDATTLLPSGARVRVDGHSQLLVTP